MIALAVGAMLPGWLAHRNWLVPALALAGLGTLLLAGESCECCPECAPAESSWSLPWTGYGGTIISVIGGALLASAHVLNRSCCASCSSDTCSSAAPEERASV
jgi:hypothetical protein